MADTMKSLIGVDITERFYLDLPDGSANGPSGQTSGGIPSQTVVTPTQIVIDVEKYYGNVCCVRVIGVEAKKSSKRRGIQISEDAKSIIYTPDLKSVDWQCEAYDSFEYCVEDVKTGEHATAVVTVVGQSPSDFEASDIEINIGGLGSDTIRINIGTLNKIEDVKLQSIGAFNTRYIKSALVDPLDRSRMIVQLDRACSAWNDRNASTTFAYTISSGAFSGQSAFANIRLVNQPVDEMAIDVIVTLHEPLPADDAIDLVQYYALRGLATDFTVTSLALLSDERGEAEIVNSGTSVQYTFNLADGYWDDNDQDVFQYTKRNNKTLAQASAYIVIRKCTTAMISGYGGFGLGEDLL